MFLFCIAFRMSQESIVSGTKGLRTLGFSGFGVTETLAPKRLRAD